MYEPEVYNTLPPLGLANKQMDQKAKELLQTEIRQLFLDHRVHKVYGISLLHSHFPLEDDERLVEYGRTSVPWKSGLNNEDVLQMFEGIIAPRSFRAFRGKHQPYEFEFKAEKPTYNLEFQDKLFKLLYKLGLEELFGLRVLDGYEKEMSVEITQGKASIMMPKGLVAPENAIEALWVFNEGDDDRCHCREQCTPQPGGSSHTGNHSCG